MLSVSREHHVMVRRCFSVLRGAQAFCQIRVRHIFIANGVVSIVSVKRNAVCMMARLLCVMV